MAKVPPGLELGLGQARTIADPTQTQRIRAHPDSFGAVQARSLQEAGGALIDLGVRANTINQVSDQNAVSQAMEAARTATQEQMMGELYSKTSQELFFNGASPEDVYKTSKVVFDKVNKATQPMLKTARQRALFTNSWSKYQASESVKASNHVASQFRTYTGELAKQEKIAAEKELGGVASMIENDWENTERYRDEGLLKIGLRTETGLSGIDALDLEEQWPSYVASSAVRGWFSQQTNSLEASQELAAGSFKDEKVQKYWDSLDPKQRKVVSSDLISRAQKVAQLSNDQRTAMITLREVETAKQVNEFFTSDRPVDKQKRLDIYDSVKQDPTVSQATKNAMRDNLYGGEVTQDSQPGLVELESLIRSGDILTEADASAFRYEGKSVATANTMRERIFPMIKASKSEKFRDAMTGGLAQLGVVDTMSENSAVLRQRAATFKFRMIEWQQSEEGKTGDPWAASLVIANEIKAEIKVDPAVMSMLRNAKSTYERELAAGNTVEASKALNSMNSMMNILDIKLEDIK